jgi:transposase
MSRHTVGKWRARFVGRGIEGLYDEYRSGRPRSIEDEQISQLVKKTLHSKPKGSTQWSCREMADATGISKSTVQRVWSAFGLKPHRQESFKLLTDPLFVEKLRDVVGLYLNPPENALVLCVDEKSQVQALERTQPMLPMGLGYVEGVTNDYVRHRTTTLFAALDIANGEVLTDCQPHHRHQEFLSFLRRIDTNVPSGLNIHLVLDNYGAHKHEKVTAWLAPSALSSAFRPDVFLVAQPGRTLVRPGHPESDPTRIIPQRRGTHSEDRSIRVHLQQGSNAFHLGRHGRFDSGEDRPLVSPDFQDGGLVLLCHKAICSWAVPHQGQQASA